MWCLQDLSKSTEMVTQMAVRMCHRIWNRLAIVERQTNWMFVHGMLMTLDSTEWVASCVRSNPTFEYLRNCLIKTDDQNWISEMRIKIESTLNRIQQPNSKRSVCFDFVIACVSKNWVLIIINSDLFSRIMRIDWASDRPIELNCVCVNRLLRVLRDFSFFTREFVFALNSMFLVRVDGFAIVQCDGVTIRFRCTCFKPYEVYDSNTESMQNIRTLFNYLFLEAQQQTSAS